MSISARYLAPGALADVLGALEAPSALPTTLGAALARRLAAVPTVRHRTLEAWSVEQPGRTSRPFAWSALTARRALGRGAVSRLVRGDHARLADALAAELEEHIDRARTGYSRSGSLSAWLARLDASGHAVAVQAADGWARSLLELTRGVASWSVPVTDAYYDVPRARTTLHGRRDLITEGALVRVRPGRPGPRAGAGLRVDLLVASLAHPRQEIPARVVGVWAEAGLALWVPGTAEEVRRGARYVLGAAAAPLAEAVA